MNGRSVHVPVLAFTVLGRPVPQGSVRNLGKGRHSVHGNADVLVPWRNQLQLGAEAAIEALVAQAVADDLVRGDGVPPRDGRPTFPVSGPVSVASHFTMRKPASAPKRQVTWPVARPDADKLVRAVLDSLTFAGVFSDDSQVIDVRSTKSYPNEGPWALHVPGVRVEVSRIVWMEWGEREAWN